MLALAEPLATSVAWQRFTGHGGPAIVGNVYLEGTWSEVYPNVTQDDAGLKQLFKQFSFPGGISSHVAPTTPGSIHAGAELGYSLSHARQPSARRGEVSTRLLFRYPPKRQNHEVHFAIAAV